MRHLSIRLLAVALCVCILCGFQAPRKDRHFYESRGDIIWELPLERKELALTFDDGPDPETTIQILDLLKQYRAKATFFVIGFRVQKYPDIIKREIAEGHEVANHTYNHVYFSKGIKRNTIQEEIERTDRSLIDLTGRKPHLFRPPGGFYSDATIDVARRLGYTTVLWSWHQDTEDWRSPGVRHIVNKVLKNARSGDIVLLHDYISGSVHTVKALKIILPELERQGYRLVTVSELIQDKTGELLPSSKSSFRESPSSKRVK
ncbi:polysaccharide deacetylase family protein [Paenibacillus sacheonensis]|uniref:Polysaccharide deacetylase family protein n=1 Tax=Paenibacillus sacheonensis TaxID=742054 RepID=A0A7X5C314_9BACL|nr:polysaccharide deacetylase family protein [Paenibacillus sacheonensis]MBM7567135.1 polysaccharide deacetylase family sporulation protein PdaB [Paenibacillus sacheonensis]NBC70939.1 polysaccharide deacetylase family protein [Paenibacillus sacheonensis]